MATKENRVTYVLTQQDHDVLHSAFKQIFGVVGKFEQPLSPKERQTLPKMDVSNKAFSEDAITEFKNNAELMPGYLKVEPIEASLNIFEGLTEYVQLSKQLAEKLEDTQMLAGSECYTACLAIYRQFEAAVNSNVSGADTSYAKLKKRFAGQGTPAAKAPTPEA